MEAARTAEQEWTEEYRSKLPDFEKEAVKTGDKREKKLKQVGLQKMKMNIKMNMKMKMRRKSYRY